MLKQHKSQSIFNTGSSFSSTTSYKQFTEGTKRPTSASQAKTIKAEDERNTSLISLNRKTDNKVYKPKDNNIFNLEDSSRNHTRSQSVKKVQEKHNTKRVVDSNLIDEYSTYEKKNKNDNGTARGSSISYLFAKSDGDFNKRKATNPRCYRSNVFDEPNPYETPRRLLK
jgi:hypothetical protein